MPLSTFSIRRKHTRRPTKGWVTRKKLVEKSKVFHLRSGPQHEAMHCHSIVSQTARVQQMTHGGLGHQTTGREQQIVSLAFRVAHGLVHSHSIQVRCVARHARVTHQRVGHPKTGWEKPIGSLAFRVTHELVHSHSIRFRCVPRHARVTLTHPKTEWEKPIVSLAFWAST